MNDLAKHTATMTESQKVLYTRLKKQLDNLEQQIINRSKRSI